MNDRIIELEAQLKEVQDLQNEILEMITNEKIAHVKSQKDEGKVATSLYECSWRLLNWGFKDNTTQIYLIKDGDIVGEWGISDGEKKDEVYTHLGLTKTRFNYRVLSLLSEI